MQAKSAYSASIDVRNQENDAPKTKINQTPQSESRQTNSNLVQRITARLSRVEEKFSHFPAIESYLQNNKISKNTLEDKFKFIELAGTKLNEKATFADDSLYTSIKDSVMLIEKQLFKNTNFEEDDLRNRILRIGRFQESNYKTIKQQINNLISDPNISFDIMKKILSNISDQMNEQIQIPNNDFDDIDTLKNITKVAYSPQSTTEMLRDSLKKSLSLQQSSQTKIQELHRKTQYLENQVHAAMSSSQQHEHSDDLSLIIDTHNLSNNNYSKNSYNSMTPTRNSRPQTKLTAASSLPYGSYQPNLSQSPRKSRAFDLDDDSEMDSFALREAFEPEVKDQYQDHLDQINAQMRRQGMSMRDINAANEVFTDCFIDLRSKILVQQDTISSLEKERKHVNAMREKLAQQEATIRKLQTALTESVKENPEYKKQLKTIQLLNVKLNQAKNKIVFNQESMQKVKTQLQEKEDQRKRTETENKNLRKDLDMIQQAFEMSSVDAENMKNLEIQSKGFKGLLERLKKTERMCEDQQTKLFNMHNLIIKLRNRLSSNGIQIPEDEKVDYYSHPQNRRSIKESASYTAVFNNNSIAVDDDNASTHSQSNHDKTRRTSRSKIQTKPGENTIFNDIRNEVDEQNGNNENNNSNNNINRNSEYIQNRNINGNNEINFNDNIENRSRSVDSNNEMNYSSNTEVSGNENSNSSSIINYVEELEKVKSKCESQESVIVSLKEENERLTKTLSNTKEDEKKRYESEISTLNDRINSLESEKKRLHQVSLKQSSHIESFQNQINQLHSEAEQKLSSVAKKVIEMNDGFKRFVSVSNGLSNYFKNDFKTIAELTQNLQIANNTITTLRDEKDSLLRILCSESNRSKIPEDKTNKNDLTKNSSTDRFQLNLQQIDEQVTCKIDDVKNVKTSILNENQKEAF